MKRIANRWCGVPTAYPRALFANGELGCWFDCGLGDAYTNTGRTVLCAVSTQVAGLTGRSGNGPHASQVYSWPRPYLARVPQGGRRNALVWSGSLDNAAWTKTNVGVTPVGDGSYLMTDDATDGYHAVSSSLLPVDMQSYVRSIEVKRGTARYVSVTPSLTPSSINVASIFDFDTGIWTQAGVTSVPLPPVYLGGGWWRLSVVAVTTTSSWRYLGVTIVPGPTGSSTSVQYAGIGDTVLLRNGQAELGDVPSAYQNVTFNFDVTEAGKRDIWHLLSDMVNDTLLATLPNLGSAATLFYAVAGGSVILPGQTIGAGAFEVLRGQRTFAVGAINRALTDAETATLMAYLEARRGGV